MNSNFNFTHSIYGTLSDNELIARIKVGDESALESLYDKYWKPMFVVGGNILHNDQDVEECIQNVFISLWKRRAELEITKSVEFYLAVSIKYQALTCLMREKRRSRLIDSSAERLTDNYTPDMPILARELADRISSSINKLPPTCRLVFELKKEEGFSVQDIADELNISPNTVKMHLKIAYRKLKSDLLYYLPVILYFLFR